MTRKSEGATAGLRRGRTLATAGLGAATLIGGLVYAAPAANAATTVPVVTVSLPAQVSNDGAPAALDLEINNTGGPAITSGDLTYTLTIGGVSDCTKVSTVANGSSTGLIVTPAPATCTYTLTPGTLAAGADVKDSVNLEVNSATSTGTVTATLSVALVNGGVTLHTYGTGSDSAALVAPHAPAFNTAFSGDAAIYVPFSEQLVSDAGLSVTPTAYTAYGFTKDTNGNWVAPAPANIRSTTVSAQIGSGATAHTDTLLNLSDSGTDNTGFWFDETSGDVVYGTFTAGVAPAPNTFVAATPSALDISTLTWVVVANNGVGGTAAGQPLSTNPPLTSPANNSVASPAFQLNVGFKDVSSTNPFKADIDALVAATPDPIVQGFGDGNFGITQPVTRGQFAAFLARELNDSPTYTGALIGEGACTAGTNGFKDVPDSTQFCQQINALAGLGVIEGYTDGTFRASMELSRQVVAGMFFRTNDVVQGSAVGDATPVDTKFPDVQSDNIFSGDINWAVNTSPTTIINGYKDGTFRPTGVATRQVTAGYLARFGQDYLGLFPGVTGL